MAIKSDLKVLMMGGRRCGKTSALASLFYQARNGQLHTVFDFNDVTPPQTKPDPDTGTIKTIDSLEDKRRELEHAIRDGGNGIFLVDAGITRNYWDYVLRLSVPGTDRKYDIQFRDCAGEIFERNVPEDLRNYIGQCDIFIVVVDTPFLMEENDVENECANRYQEISDFLAHMDRGGRPIQVLFVPVKCEKWVKEGKIDEVCNAVEKYHGNTIRTLLASSNVEVSIIPIETAGDVIFEEFRMPYVLRQPDENNPGQTVKIKCSKVDGNNTKVMLGNGKPHTIQDGEYVSEDEEGVFAGTGIVRKSTWFSLRHRQDADAQYTPHNCDQLVTHILRFMFNKIQNKNKNRSIFKILWDYIRTFGTITYEDMSVALNELRRLDMIKNRGEGIRILKSCFLPNDVLTPPVCQRENKIANENK